MVYISVEYCNTFNDRNIKEKINLKIQTYNSNYGGCLKMLREMMKPKYKGNTLEINLSKWGYPNYVVECTYYLDRKKGKYSLSMWLNRNDLEDRMKLSSHKIDTQYISGTRETIEENICRIVHQASTITNDCGEKYFDKYISRYEYELACFERGNALFEKEAIDNPNDSKE